MRESKAEANARQKRRRREHPDEVRRVRRAWVRKNKARVLAQGRKDDRKRRKQKRVSLRAWCEKNWARHLWLSAKSSTKLRAALGKTHKFTIETADVERLWTGVCFWTGVPLTKKTRSPWTVSIDRLDNRRGYEPSNIVLTAAWVNYARRTATAAQFRAILRVLRKTFAK